MLRSTIAKGSIDFERLVPSRSWTAGGGVGNRAPTPRLQQSMLKDRDYLGKLPVAGSAKRRPAVLPPSSPSVRDSSARAAPLATREPIAPAPDHHGVRPEPPDATGGAWILPLRRGTGTTGVLG